jgi:hypothetical protein
LLGGDVAGGAGHARYEGFLFAYEAIEEAGFAHVGPANEGELDNAGGFCSLADFGEILGDGIEQVARADAMDGRYRDHGADAEAEKV